jgi:hypothetical protein
VFCRPVLLTEILMTPRGDSDPPVLAVATGRFVRWFALYSLLGFAGFSLTPSDIIGAPSLFEGSGHLANALLAAAAVLTPLVAVLGWQLHRRIGTPRA